MDSELDDHFQFLFGDGLCYSRTLYRNDPPKWKQKERGSQEWERRGFPKGKQRRGAPKGREIPMSRSQINRSRNLKKRFSRKQSQIGGSQISESTGMEAKVEAKRFQKAEVEAGFVIDLRLP